jgi:hypothetical protein
MPGTTAKEHLCVGKGAGAWSACLFMCLRVCLVKTSPNTTTAIATRRKKTKKQVANLQRPGSNPGLHAHLLAGAADPTARQNPMLAVNRAYDGEKDSCCGAQHRR